MGDVEKGMALYTGLLQALESNNLNKISSSISLFLDPKTLEGLSFYAVSAIVLEISLYSGKLRASDPRGIGGRGKKAKKQDVLALCTQAKKILGQKKAELKEKEILSMKDHAPEFAEFLPRGFIRDLDIQMPGRPPARKKVRNR